MSSACVDITYYLSSHVTIRRRSRSAGGWGRPRPALLASRSANSPFLHRFFLKFSELLRPRCRRRVAHSVGVHESAFSRHMVPGANVRLRVAAAKSLLLRVRQMQRGMKGSGVSHRTNLSDFSV